MNRTEVRADALFVGCLLALLLSDPRHRERAMRLSKWCAAPAAAGLLLAIGFYHLLQPLWESVCIALLLTATMLYPNSLASRILSWRPLVSLGLVSYSVYVWQELFIAFAQNPLTLTISVCVALPYFALGSYYLIERPATRLGHRLTDARFSKPADLDNSPVPATELD